ncbi:MAG TPA: hypothetical protein VMO47_17780, partial [Rhodothermales bacterium]|nr:hypothetical protein [Rhodothermales bacterium]
MKRLFVSLAVVIVSSFATVVRGQEEVKVDLDFASFAYDTDSTLLESYLSFGVGSLSFMNDTSGLVSQLPIYFALRHATITTLVETAPPPVWTDSAALTFSVPDSTYLAPGQHFL